MKSINKNTSFGRRAVLLALAVGLSWLGTTGVYAQTLNSEAQAALNKLNGTLGSKPVTLSSTSVTITATELTTLIGYVASSSVVSGTQNPAADITNIFSVISADAVGHTPTTTLAAAGPALLKGVTNNITNPAVVAYLPAVAAAAADTTYLSSAVATTDVASAITAYGSSNSGAADILAAVLTKYEPGNYALQGTLIGTEIKSTTSLATLQATINAATEVSSSNTGISGSLSNSASFLSAALIANTGNTQQQGIVEGFTATFTGSVLDTTSGLASTATNVVTNIVASTGKIPVIGTLENLFIGLTTSGTLNSIVTTGTTGVASTVQAVLAGLETGYNAYGTDAEKVTLANSVLTSAYSNYSGNIGSAAAASITDSTAQLGSLAKTLVANSQVGANGAAGLVQSIITTDYPVASGAATDNGGGTSNMANLVAITQGAIAGQTTKATAIANAAVQQVLGNTSLASDEQAFAANFITSLCTTTGNGLTLSDAYRGSMAAGVAGAYANISGIPEAVAAAAASTDYVGATPSPSTSLNAIVQPILNAFAAIPTVGGTEAGAIAASVAKIASSTSGTDTALTSSYLISKAASATIIDDIVLGVASDSGVTGNTTYTNADAFIKALALKIAASTPEIDDMAATLGANTGLIANFTSEGAPQVAGDMSASVTPALAATLSGTITALNSTTQGEAAAIAYAAANSLNYSSSVTLGTVDGYKQTVATTVLKALFPSNQSLTGIGGAAAAIAGNVGALIPDDGGKGTFAQTLAGVLLTSTANVAALSATSATIANVTNVALAVANTVSAGDLIGIEDVANDAAKEFATLKDASAAADVGSLVNNVAVNYSGNLDYQDQATFTAALVKDYTADITNILTDVLTSVVSANSSKVPTVTGTFAAALYVDAPADAKIVANTVAGLDGSIANDAGPITTDILIALGATNGATQAPIIAQGVATGVIGLTATEAVAIADAAVAAMGVTAANQNLAATNVINVLSTAAAQQAALDPIAQAIATQLATVTDLTNGKAAADQETEATTLAKVYTGANGFNQVNLAYDISISASSSAVVATVAFNVLDALKPALTSTLVDNFASGLVAELNGQSIGLGTFDYGQASLFAAKLATLSSAVTGIGNSLVDTLVPQEIQLSSSNAGTAALISGSFATQLPASAIEIVKDATASSLYTSAPNGLTPAQSATIASTVGAVNATSITAAVNATLAQIAATAATPQGTETFDDVLVNVAQTFAGSHVPVADYTSVSVALSGTITGLTLAQAARDSVAPVIAAQFLPGLASSQTLLTAFLKAMETQNYVNAADILGAYIALADPSALTADATPAAIAAQSKTGNTELALVNLVLGYIDSTAQLSAFLTIPGPAYNGIVLTSGTAEKTQLTTLLEWGAVQANAGKFDGEGSISAEETPVVPM